MTDQKDFRNYLNVFWEEYEENPAANIMNLYDYIYEMSKYRSIKEEKGKEIYIEFVDFLYQKTKADNITPLDHSKAKSICVAGRYLDRCVVPLIMRHYCVIKINDELTIEVTLLKNIWELLLMCNK